MRQQQTSVIIKVITAEEMRTTTAEVEQVFSNKDWAFRWIRLEEATAKEFVEHNPNSKKILIIKWKTTDTDGYFVTGEKAVSFKGKEFKRD